MEKGNIGNIICLIIILIPMIKAGYNALRMREFDNTLNDVTSSLSSIAGIIIMFSFFNPINEKINEIIGKINIGLMSGFLIKIILLVFVFSAVSFGLFKFFKIINGIVIGGTLKTIESNGFLRFMSSLMLGGVKGVLTLVIIFIVVIFANRSGVIKKNIKVFNNIKIYNALEKIVDEKKINNIRSGLLKDSKIPNIVYYNGVTLSQGVKSDSAIDEKAREITSNSKSELEKARTIYAWIGSHITYDDYKADEVINGDGKVKSGAIETFNTRNGICFDYACLYVAMARAVDLPVRLITGIAFNGKEYISHAWNQVYIESLGKWINVDPTFYKAGNYFDNSNFNEDHKEENIAGEWKN